MLVYAYEGLGEAGAAVRAVSPASLTTYYLNKTLAVVSYATYTELTILQSRL